MPELPPCVEARVAAIWEQERRARPDLFNGTVFSADRIGTARIEGHWTEYRRALAQIRAPALFGSRPIRPLAVCGLLECADGLVLGRRAAHSVYLPRHWQSPPAGSVEQRRNESGVDLAEQILAECDEELGTTPGTVSVLRPVATIEHPGSRVVDIGLLLRTNLDFSPIKAGWSASGNREYDRLCLLTPDAARKGQASEYRPLLPTTRILIACWSEARFRR